MRIGVDAFFLSVEKNTGIGTYVLTLLQELALQDQENDYFLYTPTILQKEIADFLQENSQFKIKIVKSKILSKRRLWLQSKILRKQIKADQLDLFWAGGEYAPLFLPAQTKLAITIHDLVFKLFPQTVSKKDLIFYRLLFPLCLKKADYLITISHNSEKDLINYLHFPAEQIFTVYNGINVDFFTPAQPVQKENFILFVGTLQPRKNLVNLLKAYFLVADQLTEDLVIVGASGWKNSSLKELIESLTPAQKKRLHFQGYLATDEIVSLYQKASLFVAPSLHEGFGLIIAEAMAAGTAVLTSKRGAIPEVFEDLPFYGEPEQPEDLAAKLLFALENSTLLQKKAKLGQEFVQKYSKENFARNYLKIFKEMNK